jgi:mannose-6-phosphate isomerase-like protein (cupin superfamily)
MSYPDPRYSDEMGEISARFRPVSQKPDLRVGSGTAMHFLATGASTHGQFGLYKWEMPPQGPGPSAHFHRTMSESFFILSGTVQLFNGEHWIASNPGDFLYVPEGGVHGFRNESSDPASMLILFAPGAPREAYFEALAEIAAGRKFTEEEWAEICLRHDNYFIDPLSQSLYRKLLSRKGT